MKIKIEFLKKLKNRIMLHGIWDDVKKCVAENLNMGNIVEVIEKETKKYDTGSNRLPSEYYIIENIEDKFSVMTDTGIKLFIVQKRIGENYEAPADEYIFIISDENNTVLYDSSNNKNGNKQNKKQ